MSWLCFYIQGAGESVEGSTRCNEKHARRSRNRVLIALPASTQFSSAVVLHACPTPVCALVK